MARTLSRATRRDVLRASAGLAVASAIGRPWPVAAARGLSGTVTVGYDAGNAAIGAMVETAAEAVRAANPDATIEIAPAPAGNFQTQLFLALSTGRAPDVFITTGLGIGELGAGGYLAPLDPYLAAWDGWPQYPERVRSALTWQDQVWALPTALDAYFLYYRKDLFEQAGLPREWAPATPDDVLAAARQVKQALPDAIPYALYAGANGGTATAARGFLPLAMAFGGTLLDENGKWIIDSCPIRQALDYYATAYQVDRTVPQDMMTAANPSKVARDAIGSGELAILFEGSWVYGDWAAMAEDIGYVLFPGADGTTLLNAGGVGNSWYLNAKAKDPELAWALIAASNAKEPLVAISIASPHLPPREDAVADPAFQATPFLAAMAASYDNLVLAPPDPAYRQLVTVIQNATGIVATGEASPDEAVERYASEMTRILGEDRVVRQPPCS